MSCYKYKKNYTLDFRNLFVIYLLFYNLRLVGQNLVPNPSFEDVNDTISGFTKSYFHFEKKIKDWTSINSASTDIRKYNIFKK